MALELLSCAIESPFRPLPHCWIISTGYKSVDATEQNTPPDSAHPKCQRLVHGFTASFPSGLLGLLGPAFVPTAPHPPLLGSP